MAARGLCFLPLLSPLVLAALPLLVERMLNSEYSTWWVRPLPLQRLSRGHSRLRGRRRRRTPGPLGDSLGHGASHSARNAVSRCPSRRSPSAAAPPADLAPAADTQPPAPRPRHLARRHARQARARGGVGTGVVAVGCCVAICGRAPCLRLPQLRARPGPARELLRANRPGAGSGRSRRHGAERRRGRGRQLTLAAELSAPRHGSALGWASSRPLGVAVDRRRRPASRHDFRQRARAEPAT